MYQIAGGQSYQPGRYEVEGDYSQAAFWLAAGCLGHDVKLTGLRRHSAQGDEVIVDIIRRMGGRITEEPDGLIIEGTGQVHGGCVQAWNDHRIAMSLAVASQIAEGPVQIDGAECVRKSYPRFWQDVAAMGGTYTEEAGSDE